MLGKTTLGKTMLGETFLYKKICVSFIKQAHLLAIISKFGGG
jgi:hypothetical protein